MSKVFKTHNQQLKILRQRGINIKKGSQGSKVIKILEKENYYSIINGYKNLFILNNNPETYMPNTTFEHLYSVFTFDRNIRAIYLKYILKAEHHIKTIIAYEFSSVYGHDNYLKLENFDIISNTNTGQVDDDKVKKVLKTIGKIQNSISEQIGKSDEITHYMSNYGFVPLWVLVNILTLGEMSYFYINMKQHDKNNVSRYFNINPNDFELYLKNLTLARNRCAHDERFYNFKYHSRIPYSRILNFSIFNIPISNRTPSYGIYDSFSLGIILALVLTKKDIKEFVSLIDKEFKKLEKVLPASTINIIKLEMGFGPNWKKLSML